MVIKHEQMAHGARLLAKVNAKQGIAKLLELMQALRDPEGGCPWDREQSYQSIIRYTIEEVYEVVEAIETEDFDSLKDELGDLLFQIVFYAQIASEEQRFNFDEVVDGICDKLIRRHPHVFAQAKFKSDEALKEAWENQKQLERERKSSIESSVLDDIPKAMPELKRAHKLQQRAAKVGFDWPEVKSVWDKLDEESLEVKQAVADANQAQVEEELGDLLFVLVNLTRHYGVDADIALRKANQKFEKRFRLVEKLADKPLIEANLDEMESLWDRAKQL